MHRWWDGHRGGVRTGWLTATSHELVAVSAPLTLVLVHGGRQGSWSWRRLAPLLRTAGHAVYAPTLSGLADRGHLLAPSIDLDVHVEDIRALLYFEDLHDVVLVGH